MLDAFLLDITNIDVLFKSVETELEKTSKSIKINQPNSS